MSILLKNISKSYDSLKALNDIHLSIVDGLTTILIGPSGCGKSTLIRIITGLIKSDEGFVTIDGQNLSDANLLLLRRNMGYVIQEGGLFPHLTARNNIALMAKHLNWEKEKIEERIFELCSLTKFPNNGLEKFPGELSGGQRQRVSLMRALMLNPKILLLDEPLGSLDPLIRYELQNDLKEIFQRLKKTVVMVTHDLNEAVFFGDKIVLMREGTIVQIGTIDELIKNPSEPFVTDFIKAQRKNLQG